jgi:hypothetical protein
MSQIVASLADYGEPRHALDLNHATDITVTLQSHETFLGLTRDAGWTVPDYEAGHTNHQPPAGQRLQATREGHRPVLSRPAHRTLIPAALGALVLATAAPRRES